MAFITGTANTSLALFNALISFLTTNASLVSNDEDWELAWQAPSGAPNLSDRVLKGPGLAGSDDVLIGFRLIEDALNNRYSIRITGLTGAIPSAQQFDQHVNPCFDPVQIFLANQPMQYWFVANGRRFIAVVKVSTVYQVLYGGFFLPYSLPTNYSYPMYIGGSSGCGAGNPLDWTSVVEGHSIFPYAFYQSSTFVEPSAKMLDPSGQWLRCTGSNALSNNLANVGMTPAEQFSFSGIDKTSNGDAYGYGNIRGRIEQALDGFALTPVGMVQTNPTDQNYGILDGVFNVSGHANSSENIISVSGINHLVIQNVFRTAPDQFIAVRLD